MSEKTEAFARSETRANLMRAFAGESQAASRYTYAAGIAGDSGLAVIEGLFRFTARQEQHHARLFYEFLGDFGGETQEITGTYPIDIYPDLVAYLRAAQHNEYEEAEDVYAHFAHTAMEEGFPLVSKRFELIARAEKIHGDRFGRYAELMEQEKLFFADEKIQWSCLHCGWSVESTAAPGECPACRHDQGWFCRSDLVPFL